MCGFVGIAGRIAPDVLDRMTDCLTHRGPDGRGTYRNRDVALGHRRLAILDIDGGAQPLWNEDGSVAVVFNGELYNHEELRAELQSRGHHFATRCDTEAIVHAWEEWGVTCVERFDGMFAFLVYDARNRVLFGARDRMGKKPFYFTPTPTADGEILFACASEPKALREHPSLRREMKLSETGLLGYLLNDYVPGTESIYTGVRRLGAGCAVQFGLPGSERPGLSVWKYWDLEVGSRETAEGFSDAQVASLADRLLVLLDDAVERRLMADVPLGMLLSGGIDSSVVLGMMARHRDPTELETFSIGFEETEFDESPFAERVAKSWGTRHFTKRCTPTDLRDRLPRIAALLDEPLADPSILPTSLLCEFARERVTVALTGDGGDEVLAGYDPFKAVAPARAYQQLVPAVVHDGVVVPLSRWLPTSTGNLPLQFKVQRFLRGMRIDPRLRPAAWMGAFSFSQLQRLLPDVAVDYTLETAYAPILSAYRQVGPTEGSRLDHALDFFQRFYLADDILVKADRASMFHGLELRSPFLDRQLVEFVNALPASLKLRGNTTKYLLKRALASPRGQSLVPREVMRRRKKGFGIPVARWIRHDAPELFRTWLVDEWPEERLPMVNRWEVERLLIDHTSGAANNYKELWALVVLAHWARRHL